MANEKSNEKGSRLLNKYFKRGSSYKENNSSSAHAKEKGDSNTTVDLAKAQNGGFKQKFAFSPFRVRKKTSTIKEMSKGNTEQENTTKMNNVLEINAINKTEFLRMNTEDELDSRHAHNPTDTTRSGNMNEYALHFGRDSEENKNNTFNAPYNSNYGAVNYDKIEFNSTDATPSSFAGNTHRNHLENYINHIRLEDGTNSKIPNKVLFPGAFNNMSSSNLVLPADASYDENVYRYNTSRNPYTGFENNFEFPENETKQKINEQEEQKNTVLRFDEHVSKAENTSKKKNTVMHGRVRYTTPKKIKNVTEHGQVISLDKKILHNEMGKMEVCDPYSNAHQADPTLSPSEKNNISTSQNSTSNINATDLYPISNGDAVRSYTLKGSHNAKMNKYDLTLDTQKYVSKAGTNAKGTNASHATKKRTYAIKEKETTKTENVSSKEKESGNTLHKNSVRTNINKTNKGITLSPKLTHLKEYPGGVQGSAKINDKHSGNAKKNAEMKSVIDEKYNLQDYKKRDSFNYSGLLTSMVSSILTQQNEMKLEENSAHRGYLHKGSLGPYHLNANYSNKTHLNSVVAHHDDENTHRSYEYTFLNYTNDNKPKEKVLYQMKENELEKNSPEKLLVLTLIIMIFISILCNYDHGAIPVTLGEIQKDFPLSYIEQSLLGSLVYFGLIIGTIIAGVLFELFPAKLLVAISIISLSISLYIFSHANCIIFMYISRFVNGLCQAIPVVYLPVWVDEFSPNEKATQWMSYIQLASIGGTVFGYFLGGILSNTDSSPTGNDNFAFPILFFSTWRSPFLIQAFLLVPIFLTLIFIPSDKINITTNYSELGEFSEEDANESKYRSDALETNIGGDGRKKKRNMKGNRSVHQYSLIVCDAVDKHLYRSGEKPSDSEKFFNKKGRLQEVKNNKSRINFNRSATYIMEKKTNVLRKTLKEVKKLLKNKLYIIITLGMSNLYFVVTGIQFWITEYMSVVLQTEKIKIVTVSTLCFLTSPTSGVWFGGYICDLFGGYKNTNYSKTIKVATAFAVSACIFGILSAHLNNFILFSICLWLCLFNGSALVPVAVGMLLSCVDNHQKSLSSAVSQIIYNVFGWFSAPLLSGALMDLMHKYTHDNRLALKTGFTMILYSSAIGFLFLLYANFLDLSDKKVGDDASEMVEPLNC